jgi:hypothetical protein
MFLQKEIKIAVIVSLLLTYFIQPIMTWISQKVMSMSNVASKAFIDRIYMQASHLESQNYAFLSYTLFQSFILGVLIMTTIILLLPSKLADKSFDIIDSKIFSPQKSSKKKSALKYLVSFFLIIYAALHILLTVGNFTQLSIITSFQQHIRILAPYLSDWQTEEIISKWSQMKGQEDYDNIYKDLNQKAKENKIILPPNKIYSIGSI